VSVPPVPFVRGALVSGAPAHVIDRVLRSPNVARVLDNLPPWLRAEVELTARAIRLAAQEWEALPAAPERNGETPQDEAGAGFGVVPEWSPPGSQTGGVDPDRRLGTAEAAGMLGVSLRRAQQLAAGGIGAKDVDGRWSLDRTAVVEYARRRAAG
jgi:hypothetical protein